MSDRFMTKIIDTKLINTFKDFSMIVEKMIRRMMLPYLPSACFKYEVLISKKIYDQINKVSIYSPIEDQFALRFDNGLTVDVSLDDDLNFFYVYEDQFDNEGVIRIKIEEKNKKEDFIFMPPKISSLTLSSNDICFKYMEQKLEKTDLKINKVIFNNPATIVYWSDETKTVTKCQGGDVWDEEKGLAMCIVKKLFGLKDFYNAMEDGIYG